MCPQELINLKKENRKERYINATSLADAIEILTKMSDRMVEKLSPLHKAAKFGDDNLINYYIKEGYDPNLKAGYKRLTPLHLAAMVCNYQTIKALLENHADPTVTSSDGLTPIQYLGMRSLLDLKTITICIRKNESEPSFELVKENQDSNAKDCENLLKYHGKYILSTFL